MSMMNALQGKSIFGNAEESMFSTREIDKGGAEVVQQIKSRQKEMKGKVTRN